MKPSPSFVRAFLLVSFLAIFYTCSNPPALAQSIQVTAADPPAAEQGTVNLDVTIKGKGFKQGAQAQWFVTGTTNPGGVTVNSTAFVSGSELRANITVADDATIAQFDILVTNTSNGRSGKGTELFSVVAKGSGTTGPTDNSLVISFRDDNLDNFGSDGGGAYQNDVDQVVAGFGGEGFSFTSDAYPHKAGVRSIFLQFLNSDCLDSCGEQPFTPATSGQTRGQVMAKVLTAGGNAFDPAGLLGMQIGEEKQIALKVYLSEFRDDWTVCFNPSGVADLVGICALNAQGTPAHVKRTAADTWQVFATSGDVAALIKGTIGKPKATATVEGMYSMPFEMILKCVDPNACPVP